MEKCETWIPFGRLEAEKMHNMNDRGSGHFTGSEEGR